MNDLKKFEKDYEDDGVNLQSKFQGDSNQFLAPKYLHEKVKLFLLEMSLVQNISKDLKCSTQLINSKKRELSNLAIKNRCLLTIKSSSSSAQPAMPKISSGTINVSNGDLTAEQVKEKNKEKKYNIILFIYSLMFLLFVQLQQNCMMR